MCASCLYQRCIIASPLWQAITSAKRQGPWASCFKIRQQFRLETKLLKKKHVWNKCATVHCCWLHQWILQKCGNMIVHTQSCIALLICHSEKLPKSPKIQCPSILSSVCPFVCHSVRGGTNSGHCSWESHIRPYGHLRWVFKGIPRIRSLLPHFCSKVNFPIITNEICP